jgi:hypothetical protein
VAILNNINHLCQEKTNKEGVDKNDEADIAAIATRFSM